MIYFCIEELPRSVHRLIGWSSTHWLRRIHRLHFSRLVAGFGKGMNCIPLVNPSGYLLSVLHVPQLHLLIISFIYTANIFAVLFIMFIGAYGEASDRSTGVNWCNYFIGGNLTLIDSSRYVNYLTSDCRNIPPYFSDRKIVPYLNTINPYFQTLFFLGDAEEDRCFKDC